MSKATSMDIDSGDGGGTPPSASTSLRPKLTKANQELFDLMTTYMDGKFDSLEGRVDGVRDEVIQNSEAIKDLSEDVHRNRYDIDSLSSQIKDLRKKNGSRVVEDAKIKKLVDKTIEKHRDEISDEVGRMADEIKSLHSLKSQPSVSNSDETQYWFARRGIRCWPVHGDNDEEILKSVREFFGQKLKVAPSSLREEDIIEVRRLQPKVRKFSGAGDRTVKEEVLVVLRDVQIRDMVFRHASNLSAWRDNDRDNSVGVRLQIPTHLLGKFNTFSQHGYDLPNKYGPGLKRHIRFYDTELDLCMNVKLPNSEEWFTVDHQF